MNPIRVLENPAVRQSIKQVSNNLGSITKAVEGSEGIQNMLRDPDTGDFSKERLAGAVARTALTANTAERAMDALLSRPEGQMIMNIMNNPALKQKYINNPILNFPAAALKDRDVERKFLSEKSRAAGAAAELYSRIAQTKRTAEVDASGAALAESALRELASFGPLSDIEPSEVVRVASLKAGRKLTPGERRVIRETAKGIKGKAYGTKALSVVYSHRKGGLAGQRSVTALREANRRTQDTGARLGASTEAATQAGGIIQKIMDTQGPERTIEGPRINLKKLTQSSNPKQAGLQNHFFAKLAEETLLGGLTGLNEVSKPKIRVLISRNFDQDNGVDAYINNNYLNTWHKEKQPVTRLYAMLRKAKTDMSIENKEVDVFKSGKMFS